MAVPEPAGPRVHRVAGFAVEFPHEPYGVQLAFMSQVIKAIDHQENALLEAPTGCGKTLSLLCGALAWQAAQKQRKAAAEAAAVQRHTAAAAAERGGGSGGGEAQPGGCGGVSKPGGDDGKQQGAGGSGGGIDDSAAGPSSDVDEPAPTPDEPVVVPKIFYATRTHSQIAQASGGMPGPDGGPKVASCAAEAAGAMLCMLCAGAGACRAPASPAAACRLLLGAGRWCGNSSAQSTAPAWRCWCARGALSRPAPQRACASRAQQRQQPARHAHAPRAPGPCRPRLQGARQHYCINRAVVRSGNVEAGCEELLKDGLGCRFQKNAHTVGHGHAKVRARGQAAARAQLRRNSCWLAHRLLLLPHCTCTCARTRRRARPPACLPCLALAVLAAHTRVAHTHDRRAQVHDIEDLCSLGNRHKACPYFVARHLAETAELVFCPYSYLLDPSIRRASGVRGAAAAGRQQQQQQPSLTWHGCVLCAVPAQIQAAGAVLIFDEAHNIEDQAR